MAEPEETCNQRVSEHCAVLKEAGLVVTEQQGTKVVYSLNTSTAEDALAAVFALLGANGTDGTRSTRTDGKAPRR